VAGLPLPNRAASSLAALSAGSGHDRSGTGRPRLSGIQRGGRARAKSEFLLDGGNVSNAVGLTRPQQLTSLPVDAMQEFQSSRTTIRPSTGIQRAAVVTMSTRSGTNQFHGSLFESLQERYPERP